MKLFTLDYVNIYYDEKKRLIEYRWKKNTENMDAQEYKNTVENIIKIVKTFEPKYIIGVLSDQKFTLSEDLMEWVNKNALERILEAGVEKYAFINSQNFIIKNLYSSFIAKHERIKIFDDRDKAIEWFENQD